MAPALETDRQMLADLMSRYAACIDERDVTGFRSLFAPHVEVVGFQKETLRGIAAWQAFVEAQLQRFATTQHLLGRQLASVDGDRAEARTDVQAVHFMREPAGQIFTLWGTYKTQLVRDAAGGHGWKIVRHALERRGSWVGQTVERTG